MIEEEIKQGKLAKTTPVAAEEIYSSLQRQPIPRAKTHAEPPTWPSIELSHPYQNYPLIPHNCNVYSTYTEISMNNFQNPSDNATSELNEQISKQRKLPNRYSQEPRSFYENPANLHKETPRSPNYLRLAETRNYEVNRASPMNVLNNSPRTTYAADVSSAGNSYERPKTSPLDKPRIPITSSGIYSEDGRQNLGEYSGYGDGSDQLYKYGEPKDEYMSTLQSALVNVQTMDNIRGNYGDRLGYPFPVLLGKSKLETRKMQRCRTPEILLAPHNLERQACCHWGAPYK